LSARAAPLSRALLAQLRLELTLSLRRGESLLITAFVPLLLLVFFGSIQLVSTAGNRPVDFLLPGILALAVMSASLVGLGIATAFERQQGVLKRLGGTPLPRGGLLLAKILAVVVIQLAQITMLILAAVLLFGWRPGAQAPLALPVIFLGTLCFAALGLLLAGTLRAEAVLAAANGLYLVFLLVGDMVFPLAQLPAWLASAARLLPAAAFAQSLRAALQPGLSMPLDSLGVLATWAIVISIIAARTFRWE
jgi:ABC-2 type transport system permease protein